MRQDEVPGGPSVPGGRDPRSPGAWPAPGDATATPPESWPTGRLLSAAARRVERRWDAYLERWSLTHASLPVLAVLAGGPRSQRELAADLRVTEQTTSRMLAGLERTGYVARQRHAADRRRHVVALTDAGRAALAELDDPRAVEAVLGSALDAAEAEQLRGLLLRLVERGD
ncbi:MarR family winged helix-turn-helix transcriptional regulator [Georgenia sp. TF02-10]|uniref:MarR family winged helix-turn-helix transcriptional regulator n=1 Tax=Georgenia sp. TF02-10 TaxID=2917725 RepID=UPI001FA810AC|nr:MarR family winged helix-turn-helix transcriptional regulator [Georgenia sp. TF02-10]UNX54814.1 MarR family winged helix-turn-helix transcriptional regulator [Georgenia sp. TF02-10]